MSSIHGCDLITRLSGPCLLKLRRDLVAGPGPGPGAAFTPKLRAAAFFTLVCFLKKTPSFTTGQTQARIFLLLSEYVSE